MNTSTEQIEAERALYEAAIHYSKRTVESWNVWQAARATPASPASQCHHRIADARNPVITSGYICIDCGAVFAAADHDKPKAASVTASQPVEAVAWGLLSISDPELTNDPVLADYWKRKGRDVTALYTHPTKAEAPVGVEPVPNGGMHASIFCKVWGDAGGGDAGRIALAEYAFDLGCKSGAPAPASASVVPREWASTDGDFNTWCERHGMKHTDREAFDDATSLYLAATPTASPVAATHEKAGDLKPYGYVLKTGHGNRFSEDIAHVYPEVRHMWVAVYDRPAAADAGGLPIDCRSPEGIATGLIDGIIAMSRVLCSMQLTNPAVAEALKDIRSDADVAALLARPTAVGAGDLEVVKGDLLPPVGAKVLIHLGRQDEWVEHTVAGYYVLPALAFQVREGENDAHRVFVRVLDDKGYENARLLNDLRPAAQTEDPHPCADQCQNAKRTGDPQDGCGSDCHLQPFPARPTANGAGGQSLPTAAPVSGEGLSIQDDKRFSDLLAEYLDAAEKAEAAKHFLLALPARDNLTNYIDDFILAATKSNATAAAIVPGALQEMADSGFDVSFGEVKVEPRASITGEVPGLSKTQVDALVYECRQAGDDSTYAIVNRAIIATLKEQAK